MKIIQIKNKNLYSLILIVVMLTVGFFASGSDAADLTNATDVLSRAKNGVNSNHTITFTTPSGVDAGETITITFPEDFSTTLVDYSDIDITDDGTDLVLDSVPNLGTWGVSFGGLGNRTLTITSGTGTIDASSLIVIKIGTNALFGAVGDAEINNPTSNNVHVINVAGTFGDTINIPIVIIADDQIQVSGDIYASLEFSISSNSVGFGNFTNNNVRYATADGAGSFIEQGNDLPVKLTAGTNGPQGLTISIRDEGNGLNPGLYSGAALELIPTAASSGVSNDSKTYGVYGKNASSLTTDEGFDNDGAGDLPLTRTAQTLASSLSQTNGSIDVSLLAATDAATKSGNYADILTLICTGNY